MNELLSGQVYDMETEETTKPRMLVVNNQSKRAWINVTLTCSYCSTCRWHREQAEKLGKKPFQLTNFIGPFVLAKYFWVEVSHPTESKGNFFFTPTMITESNDTLRERFADQMQGIVDGPIPYSL